MAFQPGISGNPAGKPKGCRNKLKRVAAVFEELGINPLAKMLERLNKVADDKEATKLWLEVMTFVYPRIKESSYEPESSEESVANADKLMKELQALEVPNGDNGRTYPISMANGSSQLQATERTEINPTEVDNKSTQ